MVPAGVFGEVAQLRVELVLSTVNKSVVRVVELKEREINYLGKGNGVEDSLHPRP